MNPADWVSRYRTIDVDDNIDVETFPNDEDGAKSSQACTTSWGCFIKQDQECSFKLDSWPDTGQKITNNSD